MRGAVWYDRQRIGLGDEFLDEVAEAFVLLKEFPEAPPPIGGGFRRFLLHRFPFGLIYRIDDGEIVIVAVAHNSRRPRYWRNRMKNND
jgi:plasmid stabilization system protein ParE